jgi:hypothetical protein
MLSQLKCQRHKKSAFIPPVQLQYVSLRKDKMYTASASRIADGQMQLIFGRTDDVEDDVSPHFIIRLLLVLGLHLLAPCTSFISHPSPTSRYHFKEVS